MKTFSEQLSVLSARTAEVADVVTAAEDGDRRLRHGVQSLSLSGLQPIWFGSSAGFLPRQTTLSSFVDPAPGNAPKPGGPGTVESSTRQLVSQVGAARLARAWVREVLPDMIAVDGAPDSPFLADVTLCASELVTASLVAQSTTMTLRMWRDGNSVRLSLTDDGMAVDDEQGPAAHAQQLGFRMIDAIVEHWGIDAVDGGRELWVVLPAAAGTVRNGSVT
jgi:hypothetical protein